MERTHILTLNMNEYAIQHYLAKHFHIQYRVSLYSLCVDLGVPSRVSLLTSSTSTSRFVSSQLGFYKVRLLSECVNSALVLQFTQ